MLALEEHAGLATLPRHFLPWSALSRLVVDARERGRSHWGYAAREGWTVTDGKQMPPLLRLGPGPVKGRTLQARALEVTRRRLLAPFTFLE